MKRTLLATASAVMLMGTPVLAVDTNRSGDYTTRADMETSLVGYDVIDRNGEDIGDIEKVMYGTNGKPDKAVASIGGFLGWGDKRAEIDLSNAEINHRDNEIWVKGWTDAQLEALPDYDTVDLALDRNMYYRDELKHRDRLIGYDIIDAEGEDIGDVERVMFDRLDKPTKVVASVGGFLGMGERRLEIDLTEARVNHSEEEIRVRSWTEDEIEALPDYDTVDYDRTMHLRQETLQADRMMGYDIIDADGDDIGDVKEVTVDKSGQPTRIIAAVGGFLGINDKRVEIDLSEATISHSKDEVRVRGWTDAQIKALPDYTG